MCVCVCLFVCICLCVLLHHTCVLLCNGSVCFSFSVELHRALCVCVVQLAQCLLACLLLLRLLWKKTKKQKTSLNIIILCYFVQRSPILNKPCEVISLKNLHSHTGVFNNFDQFDLSQTDVGYFAWKYIM